MSERRDLELLNYWSGQMLRSRDFRDDAAFEAQRRWWHNRALHAPFGVSYGLRVTAGTSGGKTAITVQCGLAYDCFGRELILRQDRVAPDLPAGGASQLLLLQYTPGGAHLAWSLASDAGFPNGVPLARTTAGGNTGVSLDETYFAPRARALAAPRLATGDTVRGDTPWEPWIEQIPNSDGVPQPETVGLQTRIDTSAAGFTALPHYFAELQWPNLVTSAAAAFAPAFFPSLAGEEATGFTFRLLMKNITRRRVAVSFGVSAVAALPQAGAAAPAVPVEHSSAFQVGDLVARVRPRGLAAATVAAADKQQITLNSPLDGLGAGDTVAIGNPPRTAIVSKAPSQEMVTAFRLNPLPATPVQPGDFVAKITPPTAPVVRILDVQDDLLILDASLPSLAAGDPVGVARQTDLFEITDVKTGDDGSMTVAVLNGGVFGKGDVVFQLTPDRTPGGITSVKPSAAGVLSLDQPITGLSNTDQLGRFSIKGTAEGTIQKPLVLRVTVGDASVFRAGDVVSRMDTVSAPPARIEKVDSKRKIVTLSSAIPLEKDAVLVAANPAGSSTVLSPTAAGATVATPSVFRQGDVVEKFGAHVDLAVPSVITLVDGTGLTLQPPLAGLQPGDVLVARRFPHLLTIQNIIPFGGFTFLLVSGTANLRAGDIVIRVGDAATATLAIVAVEFGFLAMRVPIPGLKVNDQIVPVSFNQVAAVTAPLTAGNTEMTIDRTIDFRTGDVIAPLAGYFETSPAVVVGKVIAGSGTSKDALLLNGAIDGLIPGDLIGPASLSPSQKTIRFSTTGSNLADLRQGDRLLLTGLDSDFLQIVNAQAQIDSLDTQTGIASLEPADGSANRFRPETMSVAALFNGNATDAFVAFAQEQDLYVCWLGCQNETDPPSGCPGATATLSPCGQKGK